MSTLAKIAGSKFPKYNAKSLSKYLCADLRSELALHDPDRHPVDPVAIAELEEVLAREFERVIATALRSRRAEFPPPETRTSAASALEGFTAQTLADTHRIHAAELAATAPTSTPASDNE